jgi:hypothetical protein
MIDTPRSQQEPQEPKDPPKKPMINAKQAAKRVNCSERFARKNYKLLGGVKIGGTRHRTGMLRFDPEALERYLEDLRKAG